MTLFSNLNLFEFHKRFQSNVNSFLFIFCDWTQKIIWTDIWWNVVHKKFEVFFEIYRFQLSDFALSLTRRPKGYRDLRTHIGFFTNSNQVFQRIYFSATFLQWIFTRWITNFWQTFKRITKKLFLSALEKVQIFCIFNMLTTYERKTNMAVHLPQDSKISRHEQIFKPITNKNVYIYKGANFQTPLLLFVHNGLFSQTTECNLSTRKFYQVPSISSGLSSWKLISHYFYRKSAINLDFLGGAVWDTWYINQFSQSLKSHPNTMNLF